MTSTNAPQPTPQGGVAEVFDDTVQQAPPTVSADGGVGPNNMEAPMHAGSMNTFDSKYYTHWMALSTFSWDVSMSPAQLLWSTPIHPDKSHQWLAWDAKKYYIWAGGFDYSIKVAGTGFHAGSVMIVRIPPGYSPDQFRTITDLFQFDWKQMDPKTLEVVSLGVMDQRNIMYHYFPLDLKDKNSFGGHIAVYVVMPLATSGSGVTSINLLVMTRPSRNFTMDQLVPIRVEAPMLSKPFNLEFALDFTKQRTSPTTLNQITGFTAWTKKSLIELNYQTLNTYDFSGELLNGEEFPRFRSVQEFPWNTAKKFLEDWSVGGIGAIYYPDSKFWRLHFTGTNWNIYLNKLFYYANNADHYYPTIGNTTGRIHIKFSKDGTSEPVREIVLNVKFDVPTDEDKGKNITVKATVLNVNNEFGLFSYFLWYDTYVTDLDQVTLDSTKNKQAIRSFGISFDKLVFDLTYKNFAPPITESIITFQTPNGDVSMPYELTQILKSGEFDGKYAKTESIIFEMWDEIAGVPILPIRLSYQGIMTTYLVQTDRIFEFTLPERYKCYFVGVIPTSTPMSAGKLPLLTPQKYGYNRALSQMAATQFFSAE